jgi:hypothetical protein
MYIVVGPSWIKLPRNKRSGSCYKEVRPSRGQAIVTGDRKSS